MVSVLKTAEQSGLGGAKHMLNYEQLNIIKFMLIWLSLSFVMGPAFSQFSFYAHSIKQAFIITLSFVS